MRLRKIVMVEPKPAGPHVFSRSYIPRLGLPILGTMASKRGIEVRILFEQVTPVKPAKLAAADLVCITTTTSTAPGAYRLADRLRTGGARVVLGGSHVTFLPEEGLCHADWVLRGEAETTFDRFLDMVEGRTSPGAVPGLSFLEDGAAVHNPLDASPVELDDLPVPDVNLVAGKCQSYCHEGVIPLQTSRGCPHQCSFCSVVAMFGRKMRFASPERVAEELERRRGQGKSVFFYDDNFCASPARTKRLLEYLLKKGNLLPRWHAQVSVRAARDLEMLALMRRAGCRTVFVGFESIQPEALALYRKRQSVDDIREAIERFHRYGMWVHGMFVAGADSEDAGTIQSTAQFAIDEDIDSIQISVLTPFPGTLLFDQMEQSGRILTKEWSQFDGQHAVFQPTRMTPEDLAKETIQAMSRVYSTRRALGMLARGNTRRFLISMYARSQLRRLAKDHRRQLPADGRSQAISLETMSRAGA